MNRKKARWLVLPVIALLSVYLFWFCHTRLTFYGLSSLLLAGLLTAGLLALAVVRLIPLRVRTLVVVYMICFGLLANGLNLFLTFPFWQFLHGSGAFVLFCIAAALLIGYINGKRVVRKPYEIRLNRTIPKELHIVMLSDIHMGMTTGRDKLETVCQRIEKEDPELVLIAGDLCDDQTSREDMLFAIERLGRVSSAYGTFYVFGNHDLGAHGPALQYSEQEFRTALEQAGIQVLDDKVRSAGSFILIGRRDHWLSAARGGRTPLAALLPENTEGRPVIVLDHQPYDAQEAASAGADIQFSGHTHAGQVWPFNMFGRLSKGFYGIHRFRDMTLITSAGLGGRGNRLRSGCSAEFVVADVRGRER